MHFAIKSLRDDYSGNTIISPYSRAIVNDKSEQFGQKCYIQNAVTISLEAYFIVWIYNIEIDFVES